MFTPFHTPQILKRSVSPQEAEHIQQTSETRSGVDVRGNAFIDILSNGDLLERVLVREQ